jgi:hypothetical protein
MHLYRFTHDPALHLVHVDQDRDAQAVGIQAPFYFRGMVEYLLADFFV